MADGEDRALEVQQIVLEPLGRVQVEVVGRLVEQQDVGLFEDQPREVDARLLPAGERVEGLLELGGGDVETVGHAREIDLGLVAAETAVVVLQAVVLVQQGGGGVALHTLGQLVHPRGDGVEPPKGVAQHLPGRPALGVDRDLGDQAETPARRDGDVPVVAAQLAREDAEQRRLPAAVVAEDADALALGDGEGEPVEDVPADLKGLDQIVYGNVSHIFGS